PTRPAAATRRSSRSATAARRSAATTPAPAAAARNTRTATCARRCDEKRIHHRDTESTEKDTKRGGEQAQGLQPLGLGTPPSLAFSALSSLCSLCLCGESSCLWGKDSHALAAGRRVSAGPGAGVAVAAVARLADGPVSPRPENQAVRPGRDAADRGGVV